MIPANMIRDFANEARQLFVDSNFLLKNENGEFQHPGVHEHDLPPPNELRVPWLLISLYSGEQSGPSDPRSVTLHIIGKTFDDNEDMQGYMDAMNMIELVCQHLYGKTIIAGRYEVVYPYQFAALDDVRYPYFSAGLAIKVEMAGTTPQNISGGYAI